MMTVYRWLLSGALGALAIFLLGVAEEAFRRHFWWLFDITAVGTVAIWAAVQFTMPPRVVTIRVLDGGESQ